MRSAHSDLTQPSGDAARRTVEAARAAESFIADLRRWREVRGLSQKRLAAEMAYDASYVSKIETGQQQPTHEFARRADEVLDAGGSLIRRCRDYTSSRLMTSGAQPPVRLASDDAGSLAHSLLVRHEEAECRYVDGVYHLHMRRQLYNASDAPVTRYLIRIAVDRHPKTPERSNELYRQRPLTWEEIGLRAWCEGEELHWEVKHDRDAFKEIWLLLESGQRKLPLYPGQSTWLEYRYTVGEDKWGQWFQRAIRLPTERLSVQLVFPAELDPAVWGTETTMTARAVPVRTAIMQRDDGDQRIFSWSTESPPLHARYRFEWRLAGQDLSAEHMRPSERMRALGVVQAHDPALRQPCEPFDLPADRDLAHSVSELLTAFLHPLRAAHSFGKGMGLAAPQIGIARRAAVVQAPDQPPLVLLNPRILDASADTDEQYEGCLSFFDVRGIVERPLRIEVEHTALDGAAHITTFEHAAARLWAHEIDHLDGKLYTDRMPPGLEPVPVERYHATGTAWRYGSPRA
ncbi:MAG: peptide deformylase [Solirubrobacteraceae bacterium]